MVQVSVVVCRVALKPGARLVVWVLPRARSSPKFPPHPGFQYPRMQRLLVRGLVGWRAHYSNIRLRKSLGALHGRNDVVVPFAFYCSRHQLRVGLGDDQRLIGTELADRSPVDRDIACIGSFEHQLFAIHTHHSAAEPVSILQRNLLAFNNAAVHNLTTANMIVSCERPSRKDQAYSEFPQHRSLAKREVLTQRLCAGRGCTSNPTPTEKPIKQRRIELGGASNLGAAIAVTLTRNARAADMRLGSG